MEKKWQQEVCLKLHPTTKPAPVDLGEAIEGGDSGQRNIYSVESNFLIVSQDSCLVRDWTGSHREDGVKFFNLEKVMCSNMALTFHIEPKGLKCDLHMCAVSRRAWRQSCSLISPLQWPCFSDYEMRHLLSLTRRRVGPWIHIESMKAATSGGFGPHPGLIVSILWRFSLSWEPTWKLSEQTHRGLVTLGWAHAGSSQTQLTGSRKVRGTLIPIVSVYKFSRSFLTSRMLVSS